MNASGLHRAALALLALGSGQALLAEPAADESNARIDQRLETLKQDEASLDTARASLAECKDGCTTPIEAVALAFSLPEGEARPGRFLLDIRGGGQSLTGAMAQLFFVNSRPAFAELGTLTIAFEEDVLNALLKRARACGGGLDEKGRIAVQGCRREGLDQVNMFSMMRRLHNRRVVVDGEVRLQWIDGASGAPSPVANKRGENEVGYYQPWVWVYDADQITFVYED